MVELTARIRKEVGKRATSALRRDNQVPAVLYGKGRAPMHLSVDQKELVKMVRAHRESGLVNLTIVDGEQRTEQQALYKELKVNTLRRRVNHLDFQAIRAGEKIHLKVAIVTKGTPVGVAEDGGVLVNTMNEVVIHVLPDQLPEQIEVDVSHLKMGEAIHLRDLKLAEGLEIVHDLESIVASVTRVREEKPIVSAVAAEGEAGLAPAEGAAPAAAEGAAAAPKKEGKEKEKDSREKK